MDLKDLVIGDRYWTVADTQLVMVELISHTGHERPMNCVVKAISPKVTYEQYCLSWWELHKDPDEALRKELQGWNDKLQDLSIKKLTKDNPTMKAKFDELKEDK